MTSLEMRGSSLLEGGVLNEPMTDTRMGNLLAAVGNSSMKAILLSLMAQKSSHIFADQDMLRAVHGAQGISGGKGEGWPISHTSLRDYCLVSFEPIGLIAKKVTARRKGLTVGYQITDIGKEEGVALAGFLMDFAKRHKSSLYKFLGNTNSSTKPMGSGSEEEADFKKRSPMTRINIFRGLLAQKGPITQTKLAEAIGENPDSLIMHLKSLGENQVISYKALGIGQKIDDVNGQFFSGENRTDISLTEEQREVLSDLVSIVDEVKGMDPETLLKGKRLAVRILSDPKDVAEIAVAEREASKRANRLEVQAVKSAVKEFIDSNREQGVDIYMVGQYISEVFGHSVGRQRVWQILKEMKEDRIIKGKKIKSFVRWYPFKSPK